MSSDGKRLSWALMNVTRGVGVERGVDLVLHALFVRWLTTQADGEQRWRELGASSNDDELTHRFAQLDIFRESTSDSRLDDADAYRQTLRSILHIIDDSISWSLNIAAQREQIADAFDETLGALSRLGKQSGESDTPQFLADLMAALTVRPGDSVLDPVCGNGTGLLTAARAQPNVSVSGFDINQRVARRASMRLMIHGVETRSGFGIWCADAFSEPQTGLADVVLAQPPWGLSFTDPQRDTIRHLAGGTLSGKAATAKGDMPWVLLALDALRPGGRAALVLSGSSLTPRNRENYEYLLRRGAVEAIILLPAGVFRHTSIPTALWLLREPTTINAPESLALIDASTLFAHADNGEVDLTADAVHMLVNIISGYRETGIVSAPQHVARSINVNELHLDRGLNPGLYLDEPPEEQITHPAPDRTLLTEVELANLKAFGAPTQVPLAPLTLVYGANSAGKSTLVQSLLLLKQSLASDALVTQGSLLNVGGFRGLVHRHADEPVSITFTYGTLPTWIPEPGTPDPTLARRVAWTFEADASGQGAVTQVAIQFGDYRLTFRKDPGATTFALNRAELDEVVKGVASGTLLYPFDARHHQDGDEAEQTRRLKGREQNAKRALRILERDGVEVIDVRANGMMPTSDVLLRPSRSGITGHEQGIVDSYINRTAKLAGGVSAEVAQLLDSLVWLGPLRSAPQRVYDRADTSSTPGDGRHVAIYLFDHATVVTQVNEWLKRLEVPYTLDVVPVNAGNSAHLIGDLVAISLSDSRSGVSVTPADVGFGISQALPIVVELLSRRDSVVAIEQPETHLHPRLQARLADLFIDTTQAGGQGNQLIVETHSEHLMLRVQRRIREGSLDPRNVSVVYVDQGPQGDTTVKPLRLSDEGEFLDEWPDGFFDDRLDELFGEF
jgi:predicted ATPase/type I restriction-modification system DNA methylase subunit